MSSFAPKTPLSLITPSLNRGVGFTHEERRKLGKSPCASSTRSLGSGISPPRVRPSITSALGCRLAQDEVVVQLQRMDLAGSPILPVAQEFSRDGSSERITS
jgi:hypothetical protein